MTGSFFRIIEHTADTGFEVKGRTDKQVFENAARAFFQIMWQINSTVNSSPENIEVTGGDFEELLVNFLEEFLYLYDARRLVCTNIKVDELTDKKICARAWLQKFQADLDQELLGVKAVTYHQLYIGKKNDDWLAQVFLDI